MSIPPCPNSSIETINKLFKLPVFLDQRQRTALKVYRQKHEKQQAHLQLSRYLQHNTLCLELHDI